MVRRAEGPAETTNKAHFSDTHSLKCVHTNKYLMTNSNTRGEDVLLKTKTPPNV